MFFKFLINTVLKIMLKVKRYETIGRFRKIRPPG